VSLPGRLSSFAVSFAVTCTLFINFCAWIFKCGCMSLWAGADMACNIHAAAGRHCPWCSHGQAGYTLVMMLLSAPQLAFVLSSRFGWVTRTSVALLLFPAMGLVAALGIGWWDGYWTS
jgi:hypothetical protein